MHRWPWPHSNSMRQTAQIPFASIIENVDTNDGRWLSQSMLNTAYGSYGRRGYRVVRSIIAWCWCAGMKHPQSTHDQGRTGIVWFTPLALCIGPPKSIIPFVKMLYYWRSCPMQTQIQFIVQPVFSIRMTILFLKCQERQEQILKILYCSGSLINI